MQAIKKIEVEGTFDTRRVTPWDYGDTRKEFIETYGITLPKWHQLRKIGDEDALWILLHPMTVTITFTDSSWVQYLFERGFIWDQASVPIFKNNILEGIIPAAVHDANFSMHYLTFSETNRLFFRMLRKFGMNPIRATIYFLAVNSMFGKAIWEKNGRKFWHGKTVQFASSR